MAEQAIELEVPVIYVPNTDDMDLETFCSHMSARHADSLGGQKRLSPLHMGEYVEKCWRAFHDKLHELYPNEYTHYHRPTGYYNGR